MAKEDAAFMLWLGDNWYTREVDFHSDWGLWYRAHHDRKSSVLQNFLKAMPHLAMWDDHDFGPDNSGSNFVLKETSREIFKNYWCNPSHGENEQGVYTKYSYSDVDVFLCDDRWWRSADHWKDSVNGQPNPEKIILGTKQMTWLKNSLLHSKATFKIIMIGTQVLNQSSSGEGFSNFPIEYNELMNFLQEYKISGVLFLTGDRHHSEIIKMNRPGTYTLFDITVSPLTSGISKVANNDINNPDRIMNAIEQYNYARFSFTGAAGNRKLQVIFLGTKGEQLGEWSITEKELKN
jgi:alkaline phosphatase D